MQPFTYEEINLGFSQVAATMKKTTGHNTHVTLRLMTVNLPAHEVYTTSIVNKKEIISFTMIAPAEFHQPVVKNVVSTLFQGRFS